MIPVMFTIYFKRCKVLVWPDQRHLCTIFEDGTEVPACPNDDAESRATAAALGYDSDLWQMTLDHELAHTVLADMDGLAVSPALWAVAHPNERTYTQEENEKFWREECRVLELQRFHRLLSQKKLSLL